MARIIAKANDEAISFCECEDAVAAYPGQLDCPWCGCGWLFSCLRCQKAFTFGRVVETDRSLRELVETDCRTRGLDLTEDLVEEWIDYFAWATQIPAPGDEVIYLDGYVMGVETEDVEFTGWYATHHLARLPHAERTRAALESAFGASPYWTERERPDRDDL